MITVVEVQVSVIFATGHAELQITCLPNSVLVFRDYWPPVCGPGCTGLAFPWHRRRVQMPLREIPDRCYLRAYLCQKGQQGIPGCVSSVFRGIASGVLPSVWRLIPGACLFPNSASSGFRYSFSCWTCSKLILKNPS